MMENCFMPVSILRANSRIVLQTSLSTVNITTAGPTHPAGAANCFQLAVCRRGIVVRAGVGVGCQSADIVNASQHR